MRMVVLIVAKKRVFFKLSGEKKYNCLKNRKNKSKRLNEAKCALSNIAKGKRNTITDEEFKVFFKDLLKKEINTVKEFTEDPKNCALVQRKLSTQETLELVRTLKWSGRQMVRFKRAASAIGQDFLAGTTSVQILKNEKAK